MKLNEIPLIYVVLKSQIYILFVKYTQTLHEQLKDLGFYRSRGVVTDSGMQNVDNYIYKFNHVRK
jgi:hypothetical protein